MGRPNQRIASGRLREHAPGVLVATSDVWMTNTTVIVAGSRCLVIDAGLLPGELRALEDELAARGLHVEAGVSTHAHWDHVLWSAGLGNPPRFAGRKTIEMLARNRKTMVDDQILEASARWYAQWDTELVARLTEIPDDLRVPWSGPTALFIEHDGHVPGHCAVPLPDLGVLVAGDMVSDIELPGLDWDQPDQPASYLAGLDALGAIKRVRLVIPGHGRVGDGDALKRRIENDRRYVEALVAGSTIEDPRLTGWPPMARQHAANLEGLKKLAR
jgi:glyoxylase-like metal-dependent hydrolase (beta-lactamase superfamily II)